MPITKSAQKAQRQNIRRRKRNLLEKKKMFSSIKDFKKLVAAGDAKAGERLSSLYKTIDKAKKTKLIKRGKANRLKSRLTKKLRAGSEERKS